MAFCKKCDKNVHILINSKDNPLCSYCFSYLDSFSRSSDSLESYNKASEEYQGRELKKEQRDFDDKKNTLVSHYKRLISECNAGSDRITFRLKRYKHWKYWKPFKQILGFLLFVTIWIFIWFGIKNPSFNLNNTFLEGAETSVDFAIYYFRLLFFILSSFPAVNIFYNIFVETQKDLKDNFELIELIKVRQKHSENKLELSELIKAVKEDFEERFIELSKLDFSNYNYDRIKEKYNDYKKEKTARPGILQAESFYSEHADKFAGYLSLVLLLTTAILFESFSSDIVGKIAASFSLFCFLFSSICHPFWRALSVSDLKAKAEESSLEKVDEEFIAKLLILGEIFGLGLGIVALVFNFFLPYRDLFLPVVHKFSSYIDWVFMWLWNIIKT